VRREAVAERCRIGTLGRQSIVDADHGGAGPLGQKPHQPVVRVERAEDEAAAVGVEDDRQVPLGAGPVMAEADRTSRAGDALLLDRGQLRHWPVPRRVCRLHLRPRLLDAQGRHVRQASRRRFLEDQGHIRIDVDLPPRLFIGRLSPYVRE
jgi:hypothetical protein